MSTPRVVRSRAVSAPPLLPGSHTSLVIVIHMQSSSSSRHSHRRARLSFMHPNAHPPSFSCCELITSQCLLSPPDPCSHDGADSPGPPPSLLLSRSSSLDMSPALSTPNHRHTDLPEQHITQSEAGLSDAEGAAQTERAGSPAPPPRRPSPLSQQSQSEGQKCVKTLAKYPPRIGLGRPCRHVALS